MNHIRMKLYCNGFWSGFFDQSNAVHQAFFLQLMNKVYQTDVEMTQSIADADVLIENTQANESLRTVKQWHHTYLYSGESYIRSDWQDYSCVLYAKRNHINIVNIPLYVAYCISSFGEQFIMNNQFKPVTKVPERDVLVIVSNAGGQVRNAFMNELEKHFSVTYAGGFRNNTGGPLTHYYNTSEFAEYVGQFKYILSMENSEEDTYITEKIMHGIVGGSLPIYWGSKRVSDYFQNDRFLEIRSKADFIGVLNTMKTMTDDEWLRRVNMRPFTEFGSTYTLTTIASHIRNLLFPKPFPKLTHLYMICNKEYEPVRYNKLESMCKDLQFNPWNASFLCPTFKHTITDEMMHQYVKGNRVFLMRPTPMRKSEISLFLNFKAVWDHICKTYLDGVFLILEADAFALPDIQHFNQCLKKLDGKEWSGINISGCNGRIENFNPQDSYVYNMGFRPAFHAEYRQWIETNCVEDLSTPGDTDVRFMRRFHTRCTDSQLWSYKGCCQMLEEMNRNQDFDIPFDYYLTNVLETDMSVKYYWSTDTYFNQSSTSGMDASTIQMDKY